MEERLSWTIDDWKAVNFFDESIFHVFGLEKIEWCWRRPGEQLDPCYTNKVKHGEAKVIIWEMIMAQGVGTIICIKGNLNKEVYCEILQDDVLATYWCFHIK